MAEIEGDEMKVKGASNRKKIKEEILSTEKTYVNGLNVLVDVYLKMLEGSMKGKEDKYAATEDNVRSLKINIQTLSQLHQSFYDELIGGGEDNFCVILQKYMKLMSTCYVPYMAGYEDALDVLSALKKKSKKFSKLFDSIEYELKGKGENKLLLDYLITPVQRLPRYVLLLAELVKNSSKNHPQYEMMVETLGGVKNVAMEVNEAKRKRESQRKLVELSHKLKGQPSSFILVIPSRTLIRHSPLTTTMESYSGSKQTMKKNSRILLLMSDIILILKSDHTYKAHINIASAKTETLPEDNTVFAIQSNKMYVMFKCEGEAKRDAWIADMNARIDAVKKNRTAKRVINARSSTLRRGRASISTTTTSAKIQESLKGLEIAERRDSFM